ncbi:hypothetical protein FQR65_LT00089 [Abscondita terminalis]|nr:hypothetical protein FQR65_LT00089 [Abscondita terminalis]
MFVIKYVLFSIFPSVLGVLKPIPNESSSRLSIAQCIGKATKNYINQSEIILVSLPIHELNNTIKSGVLVDSLLLGELFSHGSASVIIKKTNKPHYSDYFFLKRIRNFIIQIRTLEELSENLLQLQQYPSWNPDANFVVFSVSSFLNSTIVVDEVTRQLIHYKITNGIIVLPSSEPLIYDVFSWFIYSDKNCGFNYDATKLIDKCQFGSFQKSTKWFNTIIPNNLEGCLIKVHAIVFPPYVLPPYEKIIGKEDEYLFDNGIEILTLNTLAKMMNFSISYTKSKQIQDWGTVFSNGSSTGTMKSLQQNFIDAAVGSFSATVDSHRYLETITYAAPETLHFCVAHSQVIPKWKYFLVILKPGTLVLIIFYYFVISFFLWKLSLSIEDESQVYKSFTTYLLYLFSIMVNVAVNVLPKSSRIRTGIILWIFVNIHLQVLYQTRMTSVFAKPIFEPQINSFDEVIQNELEFYSLSISKRFFMNNEDPLSRYVTMKWINCDDIKFCLNEVAFNRNVTMCVPKMYMKYVKNNYVTKTGRPLIYCIKRPLLNFPIQMMLRKGFPLKHRFRRLMFRIVAAGFFSFWIKQVFANSTKLRSESEEEVAVITLENFYFGIICLGIGLTLALLIHTIMFAVTYIFVSIFVGVLSTLKPLSNEFSTGLSISQCIRKATKNYINQSEIILVSFPLSELNDTKKSEFSVDRLLFAELFNHDYLSVIVKNNNELVYIDNFFLKRIRNFVVQIRALKEFSENLMQLQQYPSWTPDVNFVVFSVSKFLNTTLVVEELTHQLIHYKISNGIILLPSSEPLTYNVFSWFIYSDRNCGSNYQATKLIDRCKLDNFQVGTTWFSNQIPTNLKGCSIKVRAVIWPPYVLPPSQKIFGKEEEYLFGKGIEILTLNTLAEMMNFSIIYSMSKDIQDWGTVYSNGSTIGAMWYLQESLIDVAVGSFLATVDSYQYLEIVTYPVPETIHFCVAHSQIIPKWKNFLVILKPVFVWKLSLLNDDESQVYKSFTTCLLYTFSLMVNVTVKILPKTIKVRAGLILWIFVNMNLQVLHQTRMTTLFTKPLFETQINSFEDVIESKLEFYSLPVLKRFFMYVKDPLTKYMQTKWVKCENMELCLNKVAFDRNVTICVPKMYMKFVNKNYVTDTGKPLIYCIKRPLLNFPVQMMLRKGFPLKRRFRKFMFRIIAAGFFTFWVKQIFNNATSNPIQFRPHVKDNGFAITLENLYFPLVYLGILKPPPNEFNSRLSIAQCIGKATKNYINQSEIVLVSLSIRELSNTIASGVLIDRLLLGELFDHDYISVITKKTNKPNYNDNFFLKRIRNFIILIRTLEEFPENLRQLQQYPSWNPDANFIVFSLFQFSNTSLIIDELTRQLINYKISNGIILLPSNEPLSYDVFSWFIYSDKNCGSNYNATKLIDKCRFGNFEVGTTWFNNKIPNDLKGCSIKVRAVVWPPYVLKPIEKIFERKDEYVFNQGIEIMTLSALSKMINFSIIYTMSEDIQDWGTVTSNGSSSGALWYLQQNLMDAAVGSFSSTVDSHRYLDSIAYAAPETLHWCVAQSQTIPKWKYYFVIVKPKVLTLIVIAYYLIAFLLWRFSLYSEEESQVYKNFVTCLVYMFSIMVNVTVKILPKSIKVRTCFFLWIFLNVQLVVLYQTRITSIFTRPIFETQIDSFDDIVKNEMGFLFLPVSMRLFMNDQDKLSRYVKQRWIQCDNISRCLDEVAFHRNVTMCVPKMYMRYVSNRYITDTGKPQIHCIKSSILNFPIQMMLRKGFPLKHRFRRLMFQIVAAGFFSFWVKRAFNNVTKVRPHTEDDVVIITLENFYFALICLSIGLTLGAVTFCLEICYDKRKNNKSYT